MCVSLAPTGWAKAQTPAASPGGSAPAAAQTPTPSVGDQTKPGAPAPQPAAKPAPLPAPRPGVPAQPLTADDICHTIEQSAAQNGLPVEFFARVIWQESRFNAQAVSSKGAEGIAQFMPATAGYRGLADPFDPVASLHEAASYLSDLRKQFGNLGLAAAGYNAGPGRVSAWLAGKRGLPDETRNYVATITGWTADEWAAPEPPKTSETTIPQGVPCTRLANLILAPSKQAQRIAAYVPKWGAQLTANLSESGAWAVYRVLQKRYAALIGDREPIVLRGRIPGMGAAARYMIRISDDDRSFLDKFCNKLISAGGACVVMRNQRATALSPPEAKGSG
ncbi:MAG TPA: transglycosylase SLT domain-containing protein [Xanthobacteraceae bacterium]|nr:transglycosylase SLT domain-containing protein [Xanthobacteraceae bacterium]